VEHQSSTAPTRPKRASRSAAMFSAAWPTQRPCACVSAKQARCWNALSGNGYKRY
jgi:hypothetical protein